VCVCVCVCVLCLNLDAVFLLVGSNTLTLVANIGVPHH